MRDRRFKKLRPAKRVFLVICEGETERVYVEILKQHYRLPITIKTKVSGNYINSHLVDQYVKELGVGSDDDFCVFYIYDCDVKSVADKIQKLKGTAILTNPCIELWFLLHGKDHNRLTDSSAIVKALQTSDGIWKTYLKGVISNEQARHLIDYRFDAAARAIKLKWPDNPSTNMHTFIDILENAKKR